MSNETGTPQGAPEGEPDPGSRWRTAVFVGGFVLSVLALLTAYRYAVDSRANDWYLFQVARHTTWFLGLVGHHSDLEAGRRGIARPAEARANLAAWRAGREEASTEEIMAASTAPLTSREAWEYRAARTRRNKFTGSLGPSISFVFRPGLVTRLEDVNAALSDLHVESPPGAEAREETLKAQAAALQEQIDALNKEINALPNTPEGADQRAELHRRLRGMYFPFNLISECGAIEVMAIFLAAVVAFPTTWWRRAAGILAGIPILYIVNILRVSCLAIIGALDNGGAWFKFVHEYVWQAVYIIFVVIVWLAWVEYVVRRDET